MQTLLANRRYGVPTPVLRGGNNQRAASIVPMLHLADVYITLALSGFVNVEDDRVRYNDEIAL
jgi:hypothetical protein